MKKIYSMLGFDPAEYSLKTEVVAGITTFLTMTYILAVNPLILGEAGMDKGAIFSATVVSSAIATLVMAFYAKLPFALAPGMGLNAFFAYTLVLVMGYTWQQALAAVFFEGIAFILLTVFKVRQILVEAIPLNLRYAISVGIGLLIAAAGIFLGGVLMTLKVHGALFFTIIIMTVVGIPFGVTVLPEDFSIISSPQSMSSIAFKLDFSRFITLDLNYYIVVFTLLFMDLFNTLGTLIATASFAGMVDNTGKIHGLNKALMADAVGTAAGALCGISTVTTYVESATGVMEGGRTGMTSLTVSILFLVALFFSPLFLIIPPAATTSALVIVGVLMARNVTNINFSDLTEAVPAFITFLTMPLTYSISDGIVLGMLSYVIIKIGCGRYKEPSVAMYIISAFFILNFILN